MPDSLNNPKVVSGRHKVVSERSEQGSREIRLSIKDAESEERELGYISLKDFGKFVYFSGMRANVQKQGLGKSFLKKVEAYLEGSVPPKFGFVSNQISHANGARNIIYGPPDWLPLSQHNWMIYIPKALRDSSSPNTVPLPQKELDDMVRTCMQN